MNEPLDLLALFSFSLHPLEIVVRGSAIYWFLFFLFRFLLRRDVGSIGIADVLLLVLIADAAQNGMAGEYKSIADGFVLIATIVGWNYLLDWACYRFAALRRLIEPRPLLLIENGRLRRDNLRREFITREELEAKLRENGVKRIEEVERAYLENDGEISLLLKTDRPPG
ncbi:MAG: DUF421 domain-containing protein [Propionivibrio sp.]